MSMQRSVPTVLGCLLEDHQLRRRCGVHSVHPNLGTGLVGICQQASLEPQSHHQASKLSYTCRWLVDVSVDSPTFSEDSFTIDGWWRYP